MVAAINSGWFRTLKRIEHGCECCNAPTNDPHDEPWCACYCRQLVDAFPPSNLWEYVAHFGLCMDRLGIAKQAVHKGGDVNESCKPVLSSEHPEGISSWFHCIVTNFTPLDIPRNGLPLESQQLPIRQHAPKRVIEVLNYLV
jgi:hypothetical protein